MPTVVLDGEHLSLEDVERVARQEDRIRISATARAKMNRSRDLVRKVLDSREVVYGINTGFGALCQVVIEPGLISRLQKNLVVSHAAGVGRPLPVPVVRAMMLLRANVLAKGCSGVRPEVAEHLAAMINAGLHPVVPEQGSVGASGDLAPLAHMTLAMLGLGQAELNGRRMSAARALKRIGLSALTLEAKEGLALTTAPRP